MKQEQVAIPGIVGGLGPAAHVELERCLIRESVRRGADADRDHPLWFLVNATDIPDRTASLGDSASHCVDALTRYGNLLSRAGADFIVIPCNAAHAFYEQVQPRLEIPWLNLVDLTCEAIVQDHPRAQRIGILATDGTLRSQIYAKKLAQYGKQTITPDLGSELQNSLMSAIYDPGWGVKGQSVASLQTLAVIDAVTSWLTARGAEVIVTACTELSVALAGLQQRYSFIDPLQLLAEATLDYSYGLGSVSAIKKSTRNKAPNLGLSGTRP